MAFSKRSATNRVARCAQLQLAFIGLLLFALLEAPRLRAADRWPAFQGISVANKRVEAAPLAWSPKQNVQWRAELTGYGQSSPVVWDGQIYVTSVSGDMKQDFYVTSFDLQTGKRIWQHKLKNSSPEKNTTYVSRAAPSPACDQEGVVAFFEGGNLIALSHEGKVRWERDLVEDYGAIKARHGLGSSLEQNDRNVFAWVERAEAPYVLAVEKKTGRTVWKSNGLGVTTWSSPRLIPVGDKQHLVLSGIGKLSGLDPETGKRLWDFEDISGNSTPTPIPVGNGRFLIGATAGGGESAGTNAAASNGVVQIEKQADGSFSAKYAWHAKRATSSFGSPIAHKGLVYFVNRSGVVFCLDLKTGEEKYAARTADSTWATPIAIGERIYLFGRKGTTTIIKTGSEFNQLAVNKLWTEKTVTREVPPGPAGMSFGGPILYAAAAVDSKLILRGGDVLYAIADER